jgi:signal transduction histidine kinase
VTIDYTGLSFAAPEKVHFRYKLEGQDPDWREVVNDREVQYSNLPPRSYRFRVIASNNNGVWNETGDTFDFAIEPAYYQSHWFHAGVGTCCYALLFVPYRRRLRRLAHEYNVRAEERVEERTRIARELHDTLLQNIQGALFQFRAAYNLFSRNPEQARSTLNEAIVNTSKALAEARDSIQGLRGHAYEPCALENLLTQAGQDLAAADGSPGDAPVFTVTVEGSTKALAPAIQEEIYRIGREVLVNAFQHAHGKRIEAEIRYDERLFRLRIRDDGIGIDKTVLETGAREGHWGLPGIRERAKRTGAQVDIWSEPGAGTEIELRVPAAVAYPKSEKPRRFGLFRKRKEVPS